MPDHYPTKSPFFFSRKRLSQAIFIACISTGLITAPVSAQQSINAHAEQLKSFNIPAGSLDHVLNQFAASTGILLAIDGSLTKDLTSKGLNGSYTVASGLEAILSPTGLEAVEQSDGQYLLRKAPAVGRLNAVKVSADLFHEGSAEQGYRTDTVSQVGPWQGRTLQELPYSITVVSADLVESVQARDPDQIFRINPTTQLSRSQYENHQSTAILRGFRQSVSYRNGVPAGQYGQGTTTEDIEQIEILTGLSGFLYGPGNVGGVVNYVTKSPTAERLNELTLGNNGGDNYYIHGDFSGPIDSQGVLGYRVNAVVQDGDTAIEKLEVEKKFFSGAFDWKISDDLLLQLDASTLEYTPKGNVYFGFANGVNRPSASSFDTTRTYGQPWTENNKENDKAGARLTWKASEHINFRAAWMLSQTEEDSASARNTLNKDGTYTQIVSGVYAAGVNSRLDEQMDRRSQVFVDLNFDTGLINHKLSLGTQVSNEIQERWKGASAADIRYANLNVNEKNYLPRPTNIVPVDRGDKYVVLDTTRTSWLLGDDITFNDQWSLLAGIAHSNITYDVYAWGGLYDKSATTPTVSLVYKPQSWLTTYASYIESLEQGGQAATQYNGVAVVNAGEVFDPLLSHQFEIGAKATWGDVLLTTALFQIDKGLQYYDLTNPTLPRYVQDGRQMHTGLEFTAIGKVSSSWTIIGGLTWLDAEIEEQKQNPALEGNHPPEVSDHFAKLRVEYNVPGLSSLTVVGGVQYYSERFADTANIDRLDSYSLIDAGVRYHSELRKTPLTFRLEVRNLTGEEYWVNSSSLGDPRAVVFSVNAKL